MREMWISKKKLSILEGRIAALEKEQLDNAMILKNYIDNTETESEKLYEIVKRLHGEIKKLTDL